MLQLIDLAKENAALRSELARIRKETEELHRLLLSGGDDARSAASANEALPFRTHPLRLTDEV